MEPTIKAGLVESRSGCSGQHGALILGRFRGRKLVGSVQYSKCFFAGPYPLLCRVDDVSRLASSFVPPHGDQGPGCTAKIGSQYRRRKPGIAK